jgi:lysozyme family protein
MQITNQPGVDSAASLVRQNMDRYQIVAKRYRMPWQVVGAIHYRESGCDFTCHLANGDPLSANTIHVPKNLMSIPPPYTWESAAAAAMQNQFSGWNIDANSFNWDIGGALYFIQCWHGFGVVERKQNDAYLWNYTDHYISGGYNSDGSYSDAYIDENCGTAPLLSALNFINF